jgi:hypothetical protein
MTIHLCAINKSLPLVEIAVAITPSRARVRVYTGSHIYVLVVNTCP